MQQSNFFVAEHVPAPAKSELPLEVKVRSAIDNLKRLLLDGYIFTCAVSFGKDSSVCLALALRAMQELIMEGHKPSTLHVMNSNTGVENPVIDHYTRGEINSLIDFCANSSPKNPTHHSILPVKFWQATPNLSNNYLVNIIGGRVLFTFPDTDRKCQQMMKANPLAKTKRLIRAAIFEEHGESLPDYKLLTLIGTRFDESAVRNRNMTARGENSTDPVLVTKGGESNWTLSPIAEFTTMDVFEFIGNVRSGRFKTYSDFEQLVQVYRDAEGGECMVNIFASGTGSGKTSCQQRFGCWTCLAVHEDKSMSNMLDKSEGKFDWMRGLNDIRNWAQAFHYDWSCRNWLARTVNEETGTIKISPNAYSPDFCLDLLRYVLTVDAREEEAAFMAGLEEPRFKNLKPQDILAIDLLWNRYGYQKGLQACAVFHEIYVLGKRYDVPKDYPTARSQPMPRDQEVPFVDAHYWSVHSGFRDMGMAIIGQESVVEKNGVLYSDVNIDDEFTIDEEGAALFFGFELDFALNKYHRNCSSVNPTAALEYLFRLGVVSIYKGSHSEWDRMLRVANQIWRHGIRDCLNDPVKLVAKLSDGKQQYQNSQGALF